MLLAEACVHCMMLARLILHEDTGRRLTPLPLRPKELRSCQPHSPFLPAAGLLPK